MKPGDFTIDEQGRDDRYTLALEGELDLASSPLLVERIASLCAAGAVELVVDLSDLTFLDSTGLRTILSAHKLCEASLCNLWLIAGPRAVQRVFELSGVVEALPFRAAGVPLSKAAQSTLTENAQPG
jgi:anti-anti-sigma factor